MRHTYWQALLLVTETCAANDVALHLAGHFAYVDRPNPLQRVLCPTGQVSDEAVHLASQAVLVAWGEIAVRGSGPSTTPVPEHGTQPPVTWLQDDRSVVADSLDQLVAQLNAQLRLSGGDALRTKHKNLGLLSSGSA